MTILVECMNCFFVYRENTERPLEACPECGYMEMLEVREDWSQEA